MDWYPGKRLGLLVGTALLAALLLAAYSLLAGLVGSPVGLPAFGRALLLAAALALAVVMAYAWWGLASMAYRVERNGLAIRCAAGRDVIPMREIREVTTFPAGRRVNGGFGWPGYRVGRAWAEGVGPVRLYLTRPARQALLVRTAGAGYLISPANVEGFLADYRARRLLGEIARWPQGRQLPPLLSLSIYRDRLAGALFGLGLLLNVGLFGRLAAGYESLPLRLALSFDAYGLGDRIGARSELWMMPAIGLAILLLNGLLAAWLHRRDRVVAMLLLGSGPLVQALAWLTVSRLAG